MSYPASSGEAHTGTVLIFSLLLTISLESKKLKGINWFSLMIRGKEMSNSIFVALSIASFCRKKYLLSFSRIISKVFYKGVQQKGALLHCCGLSYVWLFVTPWTVAYWAPLSMGFSRREYWSGLPCPPPGDLPNIGIKPRSPALQRSHQGSPRILEWVAYPFSRASSWPRNRTRLILCLCCRQIFFFYVFFFPFIFISWRLITLQCCSGFCHTLTWISHGFTCIPHPDPPSHLPSTWSFWRILYQLSYPGSPLTLLVGM